jgi:hypothetical protein
LKIFNEAFSEVDNCFLDVCELFVDLFDVSNELSGVLLVFVNILVLTRSFLSHLNFALRLGVFILLEGIQEFSLLER